MKVTRAQLSVAVFILAIASFAGLLYATLPDLRYRSDPWLNTVITPAEYTALGWIRTNTPERTVFVTDIFGGELVMGLTLREGTEGGDWAIVPKVVDRMGAMDRFYTAADATEAHEIAQRYHAQYVWAPNRQVFAGFGWKDVDTTKFDTHPELFEKVYDDKVKIYRVV